MARTGARKTALDALLADPELYAEASKDRLEASLFKQAALTRELEQLEEEWLSAQDALEALCT